MIMNHTGCNFVLYHHITKNVHVQKGKSFTIAARNFGKSKWMLTQNQKNQHLTFIQTIVS
jgi:hypothetical protein